MKKLLITLALIVPFAVWAQTLTFNFSFDGLTSTFDIFSDGDPLTEYHFDGDSIHMDALPLTAIDVTELKEVIRNVNAWALTLDSVYKVNLSRYHYAQKYKITDHKQNNQYSYELKFGTETAIDANYDDTTGIITFQPRSAQGRTLAEFSMWLQGLERIAQEVEFFNDENDSGYNSFKLSITEE